MFFPNVGVELSPLLLIGMGLAVGVCSGFFGFGGGFITTPALNIFGFPMPWAIGTDMTQMAGSAVMSTVKHRKFGHVDLRLAAVMVPGTLIGVEAGKRLVMHLEKVGNVEAVIGWIYVGVLLALGLYMLKEARKAASKPATDLHGKAASPGIPQGGLISKVRSLNLPPFISLPVSGIPRMSVWLPPAVGFITGLMAGLLGVGGGFIRMPVMVYILGVPTVVAVGTDLVEVIISGSYGAFTYALSNRVELLAAVFVLIGASAGVQIGAAATRYLSADRIRLYFAITILLAGVSVLLKRLDAITGLGLLNVTATYLLLTVAGGMALFITILFVNARSAAQKKMQPAIEMESQSAFGGER